VASREELAQELQTEEKEMQVDEAQGSHREELIFVVGLYLLFLVFVLVRGGKGISFVLEPCSESYWVFTIVFSVLCGGLVVWLGFLLVRQDRHYIMLEYQSERKEVMWTPLKCTKLVMTALFLAVGMGLLGTAGVSPLTHLLSCGIRSKSAAATCTVLSFFISSLSFLQFAVAGQTDYEYGAFLSTACAFGCLFTIQRYSHSSLLLYLLGLIFALAASGMATFGAERLLGQWTSKTLRTHINSYC
jgi:hypothetical protein